VPELENGIDRGVGPVRAAGRDLTGHQLAQFVFELPDDLRPFAQAILGMRRLMQQQSAALLHMYE
jgi:hypothetical protein